MLCKNCGKINEEGKFCESCGSPLETDGKQESAVTTETPTSMHVDSSPEGNQSNINEHLDKAKHISKTYFSYFLRIVKNPLSEAQDVGKNQLVNGLITIALYALLIPLMIYLSLGDVKRYMSSPFLDVLLKPTLGYMVFILLVAAFTFLAIQLGRVKVDIKDVISRFGALLVPFVACFAVAFILAVLKTEIFAIPLVIGFIGSIMAVPALVIASFKQHVKGGLDVVYGIVLTYVLTGITLGIMSTILLDGLTRSFNSFLYNMF